MSEIKKFKRENFHPCVVKNIKLNSYAEEEKRKISIYETTVDRNNLSSNRNSQYNRYFPFRHRFTLQENNFSLYII